MQFRYLLVVGTAAVLSLSALSLSAQEDIHTADRRKVPPAKGNVAKKQVKPVSTKAPKLNPAQATQKAVTIPADAERIDSTHFRAKDEKGVEWNYVKTPFGIVKSKTEDESKPQPQSAAAIKEETRATDQGDTVKFERKTPFGSNTWTKKKSELDESEKQALAANQAQTSTAASPK